MSDHRPPSDPGDDDLRAALEDAVADVDPPHRLAQIRAATRPRRQGRFVVAGAAALAAVAVVAAFVVVPLLGGDLSSNDAGGPDAAAPTVAATDSAASESGRVEALYFIGDTPQGPRLFREFRRVEQRLRRLDLGDIADALATADDPDYRTRWPSGTVRSATIVEKHVMVALSPDAPVDDPLALQQLERTLAAASGNLPMTWFTLGGRDLFSVDPDPGALAPVSISDPTEGRSVTGSFTARGVANVYEGTVAWEVRRPDGETVLSGLTTAAGAYDRLYPWRTRVDVADLAPGPYTFVATDTDPADGADGAEQSGLNVDTRSIVVR